MTNTRKFKLNEEFFQSIDTEEKAYFLGWLFSDGYNTGKYYIILDIKESDRDILDTLSSFIFEGEHPKYISRTFKNGSKSVKLCICSKRLVQTLSDLGMVKNKSLILNFPKKIKEEVVRHFVRGYLDGDGTVSVHKNRPVISFLGTESFLTTLQKILCRELGIPKSSVVFVNKKSSIRRLAITSKVDVGILLDYLYKDSKYYLDRKYRKALLAYEKIGYSTKNKKHLSYRDSRQTGSL